MWHGEKAKVKRKIFLSEKLSHTCKLTKTLQTRPTRTCLIFLKYINEFLPVKKHPITKGPRIKFLHVYVLPITLMEPAAEQLFHRGNSFPDSLPPPPPVTKETKMLLSSLRICGGGECVHNSAPGLHNNRSKGERGEQRERQARGSRKRKEPLSPKRETKKQR